VLPPGSQGVGIQKAENGMCVVSSKTNSESPLQVQDVIVSLNGILLSGVEGGVPAWVKQFQASATKPSNLEVLRAPAAAEGNAPRPVVPTTNVPTATISRAPATDDNALRPTTSTNAVETTANVRVIATKSSPDKSMKEGTHVNAANNAKVATNDHTMATKPLSNDLSDTKEGHVAPLDIVAEGERYHYLFREYTRLSDREKDSLQALNDPVPDGCCTKITGSDFSQTLAPFEERVEGMKIPYKNDSIIHKFSIFMWNMLDACESGSIGGDASRMNAVLSAAANDILDTPSHHERIKHLLGLTVAIRRHGLVAFLQRGDPESGRSIFAGIAKEWKKFNEVDLDPSAYNISDDFRKFARDYCEGLQQMLKNAQETHGEYATKYNFNYIRIPRPKRANNAQKENADQSSSSSATSGEKRKSADEGSTAKKKKPSEAMKLIERISSVEGVPEDEVYDSCPELRTKIKAFLEREGMTKTNLCVAWGNINHNSLNRFLSAVDQNQSGNATYKAGYIFFEKLRILEGKPKSSERLWNEKQIPSGFDFSKPKGGRPESYLFARDLMGY